MNKIKEGRIRRAYIYKILKFLFSALCVVAALVFAVLGVRHYKSCIKNPIALETVDSTGLKMQTSLASFELEQVPEKIGKLDGVTYYFVYKKGCKNEYCVLTMGDKEYNEIVSAVEKEGKFVIDGPMDVIDEPEVYEFVSTYLQKANIKPERKGKDLEDHMTLSLDYDSERSTFSRILNTCFIYALVVFVLGCYGIATVGDAYKSFRLAGAMRPAGWQYADMISRELASPNACWYGAAKTYITENYLIVVDKGLSFFRLSEIKDIYTKKTENVSIGGLTYLYECAIGYSDGAVYEAQEIAIHFLQAKLNRQYEMQLEQIIEAVSEKNENVQIHVIE